MLIMETQGLFIVLLCFLAIGPSSSVDTYHDPHCGGRQVIVHLFEWKWTDIEKECTRYLGPMGFCGVQVSPPNEHLIMTGTPMRPWWERYQPISYKLTSRSGNETEFKSMVDTCKSAGVRIYVDAVVNHMAGLGRKGTGTAGSAFDSDAYSFPGVPYSKTNFNDRSKCPSNNGRINNYSDANEVRNCFLLELTDLDQSQSYVQDKISGYFNNLIDLGVAGFRIDAAKHMWPGDFKDIQAKTKDLPEGGRPFFYQEVIDRNDGAVKVDEYFDMGYVTEFRYCTKIREGANDLSKLNQLYDARWGMASSDQAFVFVDNHDNQRSEHSDALTYKEPDAYKRAVVYTLANNYGFTRIMSSYSFNSFEQGPPHNADYSIQDVPITSSGRCGEGWVCEHRWPSIGRMARFRNYVAGEGVNNWSYQDGVVSFNRGNKGFFAMSKNNFKVTRNTGLPAGSYCDLISACERTVVVDGSGNAQITPQNGAEPFVAITTEKQQPTSKPDVTVSPSTTTSQKSGKTTATPQTNPDQTTNGATKMAPSNTTGTPIKTTLTTPSLPTPNPTAADWRRTVILVERVTIPGQDLFIEGGIDHDHRTGCTHNPETSPCSIPIAHISPGTAQRYARVKAWSVGDDYLDWYGREPNQGSYYGTSAKGTPAYWSSADLTNDGYSSLNSYGDHYWIVEVNMDCSKTYDSFFEVKATINGAWEQDINSSNACGGDSPGTPPYKTINHMGRCGYLNVFHYGSKGCEINELGPRN